MSDIPRYIELQNLVKKAKLDLDYQQGGVFVVSGEFIPKRSALEPRGACITKCKVLVSTKDIDVAYGAVLGYIYLQRKMNNAYRRL